MKKIALVIPANLFRAPYLNYYKKILEKKYKIDLISWNKEGIKEEGIQFNKIINNRKAGIVKKLFYYIKFRNFVINCLKSEKYDFIVIHTIQLGIFLEKFLLTEYKGKYICDIRDYSKTIKLKKRLERLLENSKYNFISSEGYKKWLPPRYKYHISHNLNTITFKALEIENNLEKKEKYIISTIGTLRDEKILLQLIKILKNDKKYEIRCYGDGISQKKVNILIKNGIYFYGRYKKEEEINFYKNSDIINILLPNDINSRTLMPNRFYNALLEGKIILTTEETYLGEIIKNYNLGIIVSSDKMKNLKSELNKFLLSFDYCSYKNGRDEFLTRVLQENEKFEKLLMNLS